LFLGRRSSKILTPKGLPKKIRGDVKGKGYSIRQVGKSG
jgi:hypothetical protein